MRLFRNFVIFTIVWAGLAHAGPEKRDVWHYIAPTSPLYADSRDQMPSAGIITTNGDVVVVALGTPEQGALVIVTPALATKSSNLMSKLYMPQGSVLTRQVSGKQLVRTRPGPDGAITYSFRIAPEDIEHVMSGHNWQFTLSGTIADFTLTGSRAALTKAIKARSLPQKNARQYSEEN